MPHLPVIDVDEFKAVMGCFATGVAVVTALDGEDPVGFTCQSVMSLSLDPPFVALAPAKSSTSWPRIARAGSFCVNVLGAGQSDLGLAFSRSGGDKFAGVPWRRNDSGSGAPLIEGSLAWVDCELELVHDAGDHEIVIGRVLSLGLGDDADTAAGPLIYYRSGWRRLAPGAGEDEISG